MRPSVRRTVVFVAMVAAGLAVVYLLADPFQRRRPVEVAAPQRSADDARLKVKDSSQSEIQMAFGDVSFDVLPEDAKSGDPAIYRVHIRSGKPDASGAFLAEAPVITLLDRRTGQPTGELSANEARFAVGRSVGGSVTIELGRMKVGRSELNGHVRGHITASDGSVTDLACESLSMHDELVEGPGLVTWTREDLSVSGNDLRWDGAQGRLEYASGARLVLPAAAAQPGFDLLAPGGLTLDIPPESSNPRAESHAVLRGRVVGSSTDGRTLEADLLVLDGPTGTVTLTGNAALEGELPNHERARLTARQIVIAADQAGAITGADAEGEVRLSAPASATWLETSKLQLQGAVATSSERVIWGHDVLSGSGIGLRWDVDAGRVELEKQAELSLAKEVDHPLAGLRVTTPAGLTWELATSTGQLDGPVHGSLPDGTSFDGDRLVFAGPDQGLRLEGHATAQQTTATLRSMLSARTLTVVGEGHGAARLEAEGEVVVESGAPELPPSRLLAERLHARQGELHCDGPVHWTRGAVSVEGEDLDWSETEGRIELAKDARIVLRDEARGLDLRARAEGGMTWVAPPGAADPLAEGRGELRGRVTGSSADGSELEADKALIDGPADTLTLLGRARVSTGGASGAATGGAASGQPAESRLPLRVSSETLVISSLRTAPRVKSDVAVEWELGESSGRAVGLDWDSASGHLALSRQVEMQLVSAVDVAGEVWTVTADGALDWQAPSDPAAPASAGRIELRGDVIGRSDHGQTFRTALLTVDGAGGEARLVGPSSVELLAEAGRMRLVAQRAITLKSAEAEPGSAGDGAADEGDGAREGAGAGGGAGVAALGGTVADRLVAEGEVRATVTGPEGGPPLELAGERLTLAGEQRTLILEGPVSVARGVDAERLTLTAASHLLLRVDERNEPAWFEADGDVHLSRDFEARGDSLWWDVAKDQAQLEGDCRLEIAGAVMTFDRAEFAPRAHTFKILRSTLRADG